MKFFPKFPQFRFLAILILVFALGIGAGYGILGQNFFQPKVQSEVQKDPYIAFLGEIYDKILENYWDLISEEQLANLYKVSAEKITGQPQKLDLGAKPKAAPQTQPQAAAAGISLDLQGTSVTDLKVSNQTPAPSTNQKQALEKMLSDILKGLDDEKKKEFSKTLATAVLSSLLPAGRSGLFTQKQEEQLKNTVQNINPDKNLYKDLGLGDGASAEEVEKAYQEQAAKLEQENTEEAKKKLKEIAYARDVLTEEDKKKNYDQAKIEPTVFSKIYPRDIAYIKFLKFSPTTYDEFTKLIASFDNPAPYGAGPKALIFDLRANVGGAIDSLPFFLGNFLGDKQLAYEFLHKGESEPFKTTGTKLPGLNRIKQVVVLIDKNTQSSAEMMASALKKYHFGVIVGEPSKGWGTVERIFPLENQIDPAEKLSMFLVHSITIRDDGQPIEGRGVEPDVKLAGPGWEEKLFEYFRNPQLSTVVRQSL